MWYSGNQALTYNCLFHFIISNRGGGKTFWCTDWAINDFLKTGNQFIYLRRYKTELKKISTFFNAINAEGNFEEHKLEVKGHDFIIDNERAGYALPLSNSKIQKSVSFPYVSKIIFDEFLLDKGTHRYLQDEVTTFLEFYETVARTRDVKVFFLGNAISMINPYFVYFDLYPKPNQRFTRKGELLVEMFTDADFIEMKKETRFGKIIANTQYSAYSIDNEFLRDSETFIEKRDPKSSYLMTVFYNGSNYGVWISWNHGKVYVTEKFDAGYFKRYALTTEDHEDNTLLINNLNKSQAFKTMIGAYKLGKLRFENLKCKDAFTNIFKKFI